MPRQYDKLGMFRIEQPVNPYNPVQPVSRETNSFTDDSRSPTGDPCPPGYVWSSVVGGCVEINPNVSTTGTTSPNDNFTSELGNSGNNQQWGGPCPPPAGGCPDGQSWDEISCSCVAINTGAPAGELTRGPVNDLNFILGEGNELPYITDWRGNIANDLRGIRGMRGAQSRGEYGRFGRLGGGAGGGSQSGLETFTNPMLAMGSPYLSKNVTAFDDGGKMHNPYYAYGGKWQEVARAMNGVLALGQAQNVAMNNGRRRFKKGGRY